MTFFLASLLFSLFRYFVLPVLKIDPRIIGLKIGSTRCCLLFPTGYSGRVTLHFIELSKLSYLSLYFQFNGRTMCKRTREVHPYCVLREVIIYLYSTENPRNKSLKLYKCTEKQSNWIQWALIVPPAIVVSQQEASLTDNIWRRW